MSTLNLHHLGSESGYHGVRHAMLFEPGGIRLELICLTS